MNESSVLAIRIMCSSILVISFAMFLDMIYPKTRKVVKKAIKARRRLNNWKRAQAMPVLTKQKLPDEFRT